jgi:hypothetical protein
MTIIYGLGMLLLGVVAISIAAVITYFIINR